MHKNKQKIDRCSIAHATGRARNYVENYEKKADACKRDSAKGARLKLQQCKSCFYFFDARVGGAAITHQECGICDMEMMFGNTCTDPICYACAVKNGLCNRCGGDIEMKDRRKPYPFMAQ